MKAGSCWKGLQMRNLQVRVNGAQNAILAALDGGQLFAQQMG
jgi:hypothetical protein